ncbi:MAG TPA: phytoene desaturase family protein [Burkholderiaceae bacterium]|nr:phytoene desaturase family protein [Burkholderiaceae bacterium]
MTTSIAPVPPAASRLPTGAHRKHVVVIGAGVGGLASAVRLAAAGYRVTVVERHEGPGGRAGTWRSEGFTFDTGPSLVMMLECWRDLFAAAGRRLEDYLSLVQIDPCYRLTFTDGSTFEMTSQLNRLVENMEALEPGAGARVHRWLAETGELYHGGLAFIRRNMHNPLSMMNISAIGARGGMRALGDLQAMARRHFRDERLQQAITFQTLYLGISPYRSPGVYGLLAHSEVAGGIHYPMGGMHQLPLALERLGAELGVEYLYESPVTRLERDAGRITAATTADGRRLTADVFVANSDLPWTYQELLGEKLPTGSRDAAGQWLGHEFLRELTGVQVSGEIAPDGARRFVIPFGDTPVNHAVPAGRRIWVGQLAEKPLLLQGGVVAATYMDWARTVLKRDDQPAAIVYEEGTGPGRPTGSGRRVVFGYAETAWSFQPDDYQALAEQALRWLQHRPQAAIAAWPNGQRAAQLLEMDTEEGFANAVHFAELMAQVRGAGTFYCLTQEVRRHVELVRRLARDHEVAFHGEVHLGFQSLSRDKQRRRLERMLAEMKQGLGTGPDGWPLGAGRGFRAPTESYDDATESLLRELGLRHHTADPNRSNDRLPMFAAAGASDAAGDLVVLPRGQLDDLNYMQLQLSAEQVGQALVGEYEYNRRLGGLAIVSVHSQNFAPASQLLTRPLHTSLMTVATEALIRHIGPAHEGVWIAPGGQIADWWRERSRASLTTRAGDGGTLELELSVAGKAPLQGLTLLIDHRSDGRMPIWQRSGAAPAGGTPLPTLRKLDRFSSLLVFPTLPAGRHSYRVVLP